VPAGVDTSVSHPARIWNYWLGGKDNYEVDRKVGARIRSMVPELPRSALADRDFLARAVKYLAGEQGLRQFLDIGTGLPTASNTHEVAQHVAADSRVVYVDNDPLVLVHARALLTSTPEGACDYIEADARDPCGILKAAAGTLDFGKPVAIMMLGLLNFILDFGEAHTIVRQLLNGVPAGSYVVISHPTTEVDAAAMTRALAFWNRQGSTAMTLRTRGEMERLFDGLDLIDPGVVSCTRWRPGPSTSGEIRDVTHFGGVARKL
jgi:S-adenosyl methyltransferase